MNQRRPLFSRSSAMRQVLAFSLATTLVLPSPTFALRQAGLEENTAKQEFLDRLGVVAPASIPAMAGMEEIAVPDQEILAVPETYIRGWNGSLVLLDTVGEEVRFSSTPLGMIIGEKRHGMSISSEGYRFWVARGEEGEKGLNIETPREYIEGPYSPRNLKPTKVISEVLSKWNAELRFGRAAIGLDGASKADVAFVLRNLDFLIGELQLRAKGQQHRFIRLNISDKESTFRVEVEIRFVSVTGREKIYLDIIDPHTHKKQIVRPTPDLVLTRADLNWPPQPPALTEKDFLTAIGGLIGGLDQHHIREWSLFPKDRTFGMLRNRDHSQYLYGEAYQALYDGHPAFEKLTAYLKRLTEWLYGVPSPLLDRGLGELLALLPAAAEHFSESEEFRRAYLEFIVALFTQFEKPAGDKGLQHLILEDLLRYSRSYDVPQKKEIRQFVVDFVNGLAQYVERYPLSPTAATVVQSITDHAEDLRSAGFDPAPVLEAGLLTGIERPVDPLRDSLKNTTVHVFSQGTPVPDAAKERTLLPTGAFMRIFVLDQFRIYVSPAAAEAIDRLAKRINFRSHVQIQTLGEGVYPQDHSVVVHSGEPAYERSFADPELAFIDLEKTAMQSIEQVMAHAFMQWIDVLDIGRVEKVLAAPDQPLIVWVYNEPGDAEAGLEEKERILELAQRTDVVSLAEDILVLPDELFDAITYGVLGDKDKGTLAAHISVDAPLVSDKEFERFQQKYSPVNDFLREGFKEEDIRGFIDSVRLGGNILYPATLFRWGQEDALRLIGHELYEQLWERHDVIEINWLHVGFYRLMDDPNIAGIVRELFGEEYGERFQGGNSGFAKEFWMQLAFPPLSPNVSPEIRDFKREMILYLNQFAEEMAPQEALSVHQRLVRRAKEGATQLYALFQKGNYTDLKETIDRIWPKVIERKQTFARIQGSSPLRPLGLGESSFGAGLEEQQVRELEAAIQRDIATIAQRLGKRLQEEPRLLDPQLLGVGPQGLKEYGPEITSFLNRLKSQVSSLNLFVVLIGKGASSYEWQSSFLLGRETSEAAAAVLSRWKTGRLEYFATAKEVEQLATALKEWDTSLIVISQPVDTLPLVLAQILANLAGLDPNLSQAEAEAFYGIDLNDLADHLKELSRIGV